MLADRVVENTRPAVVSRGSVALDGVKRALDVILSVAILLLCAPFFLLIALAIKLTSPGSVFYPHPRLGRNGVEFKALKFRTMVVNSDRILEAYLAQNPAARREWLRTHKLKNDPRVTPAGRWLRRFSLDEWPQLWNVLRGEMSLVGPRPIVTEEISKYGRSYEVCSRVRPGMTGLWQVSGRNNTTYEQRVAYDEQYVRNRSIGLDFEILMRTVKVVLKGDGAY